MIIETKKLWFKKAQIFLEDKLPDIKYLENKYDSVVIVSHKKLDLPGWNLKEKDTALIDLTLPDEEIFKKFSDTTRNEIRRTYNNEDLTFELNQNFEKSYDLYCKFEKSQGRKPVNSKEMKSFKLGLALLKNDPIYGFYIIESYPYARIRSIFSKRLSVEDREVMKIISNSGRRLLWEICRDLKKRGFVFLDMASVNQSNSKSANIAKFKLSFGGEIIREYTYMYQSVVFQFLVKILGFLRKIF